MGFVVVLFVAALVEKNRVRVLEPLGDDHAPSSRKALGLDEEAHRAGLLFVGAFRDNESSLLKVNCSIYLSEDGLVMMVVPSATRTIGYRLYSQMADDVWLETGQVTGGSDLSNYRLSAVLPDCNLEQVLHYHRDRVAAYDAEPIPFDPETLIDDLYRHDRRRAEDAVARGLATWTDDQQRVWRHTLRGAAQQVTRLTTGFANLGEETKLAEKYKAMAGPAASAPD